MSWDIKFYPTRTSSKALIPTITVKKWKGIQYYWFECIFMSRVLAIKVERYRPFPKFPAENVRS